MPESISSLQEADKAKSEAIDKSLEKTGWSSLETSADNMNAVLKNAGVSGISVKRLFNHPGKSDSADGIHAVILFYKWRPDKGNRMGWNPSKTPSMFAAPPVRNGVEDDSGHIGERIMFFNQTVTNASSTQALMVAVLNIAEKAGHSFKLGPDLVELKNFVKPLDPILRTSVICGSEVVLQAHNRAAKRLFEFQDPASDLDSKASETMLADEFWLYTIFLPDFHSDTVFELEGMGAEVKVVGKMDASDTSWTNVVEDSIDERIGELRVRGAPFRVYGLFDEARRKSPEPLDKEEEKVQTRGMPHENGISSPGGSQTKKRRKSSIEGGEPSNDQANKRRKLRSSDAGTETDTKFRSWDLSDSDQAMHSHDYTPFLVEMMKLMASRGDVHSIMRETVMAEEQDADGGEKQKSEAEEDDVPEYTVEIEGEVEADDGELEDGEVEEGEVEEGGESSGHEDDDAGNSIISKPVATPEVYSDHDQSEDGLRTEDVKQEEGGGNRQRSHHGDMEDESRSESSGGTSTDDE